MHEVPQAMRLLQVCTTFRPGGIQRHVLDLTAWLRERGHHVALAGAPGLWLDASRDRNFLPLELHEVGVEGGALPRRLVNAVTKALRLRTFVRREGIDLIHAHESAPALVSRLAAIGMPIPILLTYHGSEPERIAAFGRMARFTARRVVTPSHACADALQHTGGVPAAKLMVIGLGVAAAMPQDPSRVAALRRELLGPRGRRIVLTVARLAHQKGIDVLLEVVRRATRRDARLRFVVVGDGPLRERVDEWTAEADLSDYVVFVGHSDRVQEYLAAADMFLLTSRWEALPITIVEAFRAGLPVVATDVGGVREIVDDSVGKLVASGDADALARSVEMIAGDDALRARLGENARVRAAQPRFSPASVHQQFERAYAELLECAKRAAA